LNWPNENGAGRGFLIDFDGKLAPPTYKHFDAEIECANGEMRVLDANGTVAAETALVFENIRAFTVPGNMSSAHNNKYATRRLLRAIEVSIVRLWYAVVGWLKTFQYPFFRA
jgi:hypothetical protein